MKYLVVKIHALKAREILDSRGNPTVEADVLTNDGIFRAAVPSGASTGQHEALELRDKEKRYRGKGVLKAVNNVKTILAQKLKGLDCTQQHEIDTQMIDLAGENKAHLGANAVLAVSMACCRAATHAKQQPLYQYLGDLAKTKPAVLPIPQMNVINGGAHAGLENDVQEHMIMPVGAKSFHEALQMGTEVYHELKSLLKKKFGARATLIADEGGFVPPLNTVTERLDLILSAIDQVGYGSKVKLALDCAASEFYSTNKYTLGKKGYSVDELIDYYADLIATYPIVSLEDGLAEDDWQGWQALTKKIGKKVQIVGDDNLVTNPERIKKAIATNACNALLLKVNQIGTVTETIHAAALAQKNNWKVVVSHRSGETEDSFIADLVVALNAGQSKFGAPARSDRNAKYNQLLRIEEELGKKARYATM